MRSYFLGYFQPPNLQNRPQDQSCGRTIAALRLQNRRSLACVMTANLDDRRRRDGAVATGDDATAAEAGCLSLDVELTIFLAWLRRRKQRFSTRLSQRRIR